MDNEQQCRRLRNALDRLNRARSDAINSGHVARNTAWDARRESQDLQNQKTELERVISLAGGVGRGVRIARNVAEAFGSMLGVEKLSELDSRIERQSALLSEAEREIDWSDYLAETAVRELEDTGAQRSALGCH